MQLSITEAISRPGSEDRPNEDRIILESGLAVVLDGATGLGAKLIPGARSDAEWFGDQLRREIRRQWIWHGQFRIALKEAIAEVAAAFDAVTREHPDIQAYAIPSASMVALAIEDGKVNAYAAGDCSLLHAHHGQITNPLPSGALERLDHDDLAIMRAILNDGHTVEHARAMMQDRLRDKRASMNTPQGYPVLSARAASPMDLVCRTLDVESGDQCVLMSDGFAMHFEYEPGIQAQYLDPDRWLTLAAGLERLRMFERQDADMRAITRFKVHDDASAVKILII